MKQSRHYIITLLGLLLLALGLWLLRLGPESSGVLPTLPYLSIGVGCGMFGHGLGEILRTKAVKRDPDLAKHLEIEAGDERNVSHANASKAKGFDMMTYVFAALMVAYALMDASFRVILPFVSAYLFVQCYAVYHRLRLDREQ